MIFITQPVPAFQETEWFEASVLQRELVSEQIVTFITLGTCRCLNTTMFTVSEQKVSWRKKHLGSVFCCK